jgi:hypothetical protein
MRSPGDTALIRRDSLIGRPPAPGILRAASDGARPALARSTRAVRAVSDWLVGCIIFTYSRKATLRICGAGSWA